MIAFALSLPSTSHTICIGIIFHHVNPYIEIATEISDVQRWLGSPMSQLLFLRLIVVISAYFLVAKGYE